jgi:hypothetical protein
VLHIAPCRIRASHENRFFYSFGQKPYREPRENANLQNMLAIVTVIPQISGESDWKLLID